MNSLVAATRHGRLLAAIVCFIFSMAQIAGAQFGQEDQRTGQFIEPSRTLKQILRDAEQASEEKRWGDVVLGLGELLARPTGLDPDDPLGGEDFFMDASANESLHKESVRRKAESIIGGLPDEGLQTYRLRYGSEAERMLTQATANRDWRQLAEISRRFLHTEAGYQATLLLAGHELSRGQPLAAALILQRLQSSPAARNAIGAELTNLLQLTWNLAGKTEIAATLGGPVDRKLVQADNKQASRAWDVRQSQLGTIVNGGNAARTGDGGGALPIVHPRWKSFLTSSVQEAKLLEEVKQSRRSSSDIAVPTWRPLVAGKYLLARTTERLVGIDRNQGDLIWHYPWGELEPSDQFGSTPLSEAANDSGPTILANRVWHDVPYGCVTSDGRRAFMVDGLEPLERTPMGNIGGIGGIRAGVRPRETETTSLVAVDLETEGKLLWSISGRETAEPALQGAFFLGPPLPIDGLLYVIFEVGGDTYLACLRAEDGSFQWRQHLTTSETGMPGAEPWKRTIGAVPSLANGVIVCPTSQGVVVAVDVVTRSLRWAIALQRTRVMGQYPGNVLSRNNIDPTEAMDRWLDGAAIISDGVVLIGLPECDELLGVDLLSGELRWPSMKRDKWRYIAGVRDGKFFLVSDQSIMAFHVSTQSKAWPAEINLPPGHRIAGRAVFGDNSIIVPTTNGAMLSYSLADGQLLGSVQVAYPTGNLVAADGTLFSQGVTEIGAAYLGGSKLESMIESRLAVNPQDIWALTRRSEGYIEAGKLKEAVENLRVARKQSNDEELRVLLVEAMLGLVRQEPQSISQWADELEKLAELPDEKVELQRVLTDAALRQDNYFDAMKRLVALSRLTTDTHQNANVKLGNRNVALDDWIGARVAELVRSTKPEELGQLAEPVRQWISTFEQPTAPVRERLLRQFGSLEVGSDLRVGLVRRLIEDREFLRAERLILESLADRDASSSDAIQSDRVWHLLLAKLYTDAGWVQDAKAALRQGESLGGEATREELGGITREDLLAQLEDVPEESFWHAWPPYFSTTVRNQEINANSELLNIRISSRRGLQWEGWQLGDPRNGDVRLLNPAGAVVGSYTLANNSRTDLKIVDAVIDGGLLLIATRSDIFAIDLFQINVSNDFLWRYATGSDTSSISNPLRDEGRLVRSRERDWLDSANQPYMRFAHPLLRRGLIYSSGRFICLNLLDGTEHWSLGLNDPAFAELKQSRSVYVTTMQDAFAVVPSNHNKLYLIDPRDGEIRETVPIDANKQVLRLNGSKLLWARAGDSEAAQPIVGIDDLEQKKELISATCSAWSGIGNRWQLIADNSGKVIVWDLASGKKLTEADVDLSAPLDGVAVMEHHDRLLIMTRLSGKPIDTRTAPGEEVFGPMLAVSLLDGKLLWRSEVSETFSCRIEQPTGWPLLIFTRDVPTTPENARRVSEYRALDVRDGKFVDTRQTSNIRNALPSVTIENDESAIVRFGKLTVFYTFTQNPPDPNAKPKTTPETEVDPFGLFDALEPKR